MLIGRVASVRQSKGLYILCEGIDLHFDLRCWEVGCQILGRILRKSQRYPQAEVVAALFRRKGGGGMLGNCQCWRPRRTKEKKDAGDWTCACSLHCKCTSQYLRSARHPRFTFGDNGHAMPRAKDGSPNCCMRSSIMELNPPDKCFGHSG